MILLSTVKVCRGRSRTWKWLEDFESMPHRAVTFLVERDKEIQVPKKPHQNAAVENCQGEAEPKEEEKDKKMMRKRERWRTR